MSYNILLELKEALYKKYSYFEQESFKDYNKRYLEWCLKDLEAIKKFILKNPNLIKYTFKGNKIILDENNIDCIQKVLKELKGGRK